MRRGLVAFTLQGLHDGARAARVGLVVLAVLPGTVSTGGTLACALGSLPLLRGRQLHTRATCLGQADGDGLLRGAGAMLALADMFDLFPDIFARLRGRRLALTFVLASTLDCRF